jgi:hypothetical protein
VLLSPLALEEGWECSPLPTRFDPGAWTLSTFPASFFASKVPTHTKALGASPSRQRRGPMGPTLGRSKSNAKEAFDRTLTSCQSLVPTSVDRSSAPPCNRQGGLFGPVWSRRALGVTTGVHYIAFFALF